MLVIEHWIPLGDVRRDLLESADREHPGFYPDKVDTTVDEKPVTA